MINVRVYGPMLRLKALITCEAPRIVKMIINLTARLMIAQFDLNIRITRAREVFIWNAKSEKGESTCEMFGSVIQQTGCYGLGYFLVDKKDFV